MKKYTFELVIDEGNDHFWDSLKESNSTGCDDVTAMVSELLEDGGPYVLGENCHLKLVKYEDTGDAY